MSFQIKKIVLFNASGKTRKVEFRTNAVNIITGASKTGKSAIIHIIDYCLGGNESFIPEGVIAKNCAWYGLHIAAGKNEIFIARKNPGPKRSSEEIYIIKGNNLKIPDLDSLSQNINSEGLRQLLSTFVGIGDYSFEVKQGNTRNSGYANIGKGLIYCFQEQSEIDNQKFLFHRQGEPFVPQSIQDYMPFFLGAVSQEFSSDKEKLRAKQRQLKILEDAKRERENIKGRSLVRAISLISEAKSVGLIEQNKQINDDWESIKGLLADAETKKQVNEIDTSSGGSQLQVLLMKQSELRDSYRGKLDEIVALKDFKTGGSGFSVEATEQKARLTSIEIFPEAENESCPLCLSSNGKITPSIKIIRENLNSITHQLENVSNDISHIDKMILNSEKELEKISVDMKQSAQDIDALYALDKKFQKIRDDNARRALVQGRIGLYLEALQEPAKDADEDSKIESLKREIDRLDKKVGEFDTAEKFNSILHVLSEKITNLAKHLKLEHSEYSLRLDPRKLTVVADTEDGPLPLARMGSGDTWVSLHLIVHLVLHQWFAKKKLPVPNFVVFDQPSQAYFPPDTTEETIRDDSDREAVKNMFLMIKNQTQGQGFQVIITEHADINVPWYQEMVLEKWWDKKTKLVPIDWLQS